MSETTSTTPQERNEMRAELAQAVKRYCEAELAAGTNPYVVMAAVQQSVQEALEE